MSKKAESGEGARFTPGPLQVCERGDYGDYDGECVVVCGDDRKIAVFLGDEAVGNAQLFAAAPDLLDALQRIISWEDHTNWLEPIPVDIADDIRAAVARATGQKEGKLNE